MNLSPLISQISLGEDSTRQFKQDVKNAKSLGAEMAAFANTEGGRVFIGVTDDASVCHRSDLNHAQNGGSHR